ncbi:hypothetical protein DC3_27540 [Deinococcus cellulosilyticus NBRC 106333 = KACC 11606]|uniref:DUF4261 domain-containing protein n=1 Tax=Deinococcus cellulosilyticus (strain DSM 18568 / NBRC 106333 / KACC 11606 / 5516J-15) TaxID=1223518 RepID=A0A511N2N8_DEIC1|nr:hypothetical protein DC3_27540 [Deinococcus cellulosilyticus NBRC 106333 = KACC 11606]
MQEPEPAEVAREGIILLFEAVPDLLRGLIQLRQVLQDPEAQLDRLEGTNSGAFHFGPHKIRVVGLPAALPRDVQQRTIHLSHWPQTTKDSLYQHRAHLVCFYEGTREDAREQLLALYQLALAFGNLGLLGVADEAAFNVTPVAVVQDIFTSMKVGDLKTDFPAMLWTNLLKFHRPDGPIWYATRGFERFGAPNFALLGQPGEAAETFDLFTALLRYVVSSGAELQAGHTAEVGNLPLRFVAPYEYEDFLKGKGELLVVEVVQMEAENTVLT